MNVRDLTILVLFRTPKTRRFLLDAAGWLDTVSRAYYLQDEDYGDPIAMEWWDRLPEDLRMCDLRKEIQFSDEAMYLSHRGARLMLDCLHRRFQIDHPSAAGVRMVLRKATGCGVEDD